MASGGKAVGRGAAGRQNPASWPSGPHAAAGTPFRHVAVCLDRSALAVEVLPHARAIASALGARLSLLHVLEPGTTEGASSSGADAVDWQVRRLEAQTRLDALSRPQKPSDPDAATAILEGVAAEEICAFAAEHEIDLAVLSSHGEHGRGCWRIASTAQKLLEGMPGSVLFVPAAEHPSTAPRSDPTYERILVPLDGSRAGEAALALAARLASAHGAELLLVHALEAPDLIGSDRPAARCAELAHHIRDYNERTARAYLASQRDRLAAGRLRPRVLLVTNEDARRELVRTAKREHADLIVCSAHGRSNRPEDPLGAVAAYLLEHGPVPVLLLRDASARPGPVRGDLPDVAARAPGLELR